MHSSQEERRLIPTDLGESQSIALKELGDLNASFTAAKTRRIELGTRLAELRQSVQHSSEKLQSLAKILNDALIEDAQRKYAELEGELANLSKSFEAKHPRVVASKAQIEKLRG